MTDHTLEPWFTAFDLGIKEGQSPETMRGGEYLAKIKGVPPSRIIACVDACAGIPTAQLEAGSVAKLQEAAGNALQYILLAHGDALNSNSQSLVKIAKRDFETLQAALTPFRGTEP